VLLFCILIHLEKINNFNETTFAKNGKWEHGGSWNLKSNILKHGLGVRSLNVTVGSKREDEGF
jgi:hypothetical protein